VDWKYHLDFKKSDYDPNKIPRIQREKMMWDARVGIVVLGFGVVCVGYWFFNTLPSLLDLLFVLFGFQTSLCAPVICGLIGKARATLANAAVMSMAVGSAIALGSLIAAINGITILGLSVALWSPILVLVFSVSTFSIVGFLRTPLK